MCRLCLTHHNTHETYLICPVTAISENTWSFDFFWHSFSFHRISFCSSVYMYVHGMRSRCMEDFGIFFEMCSRVSRLNFTRESSFKGIPLDWALANVFEDLDFLSHNYCEQNKTARSEIYQRHRHLNLSLDQNVHLPPQAHHSFEINLM